MMIPIFMVNLPTASLYHQGVSCIGFLYRSGQAQGRRLPDAFSDTDGYIDLLAAMLDGCICLVFGAQNYRYRSGGLPRLSISGIAGVEGKNQLAA